MVIQLFTIPNNEFCIKCSKHIEGKIHKLLPTVKLHINENRAVLFSISHNGTILLNQSYVFL